MAMDVIVDGSLIDGWDARRQHYRRIISFDAARRDKTRNPTQTDTTYEY